MSELEQLRQEAETLRKKMRVRKTVLSVGGRHFSRLVVPLPLTLPPSFSLFLSLYLSPVFASRAHTLVCLRFLVSPFQFVYTLCMYICICVDWDTCTAGIGYILCLFEFSFHFVPPFLFITLPLPLSPSYSLFPPPSPLSSFYFS